MALGCSIADLSWLTLGELSAAATREEPHKPRAAFTPDLDYALSL